MWRCATATGSVEGLEPQPKEELARGAPALPGRGDAGAALDPAPSGELSIALQQAANRGRSGRVH